MKKLALSAVSALLAALFFGCAIETPIVPLIPTESTADRSAHGDPRRRSHRDSY